MWLLNISWGRFEFSSVFVCQRWSPPPPNFSECLIVALPVLIQQQLLLTCCGTVTPALIQDSIWALKLNHVWFARFRIFRKDARRDSAAGSPLEGDVGPFNSGEKNLHWCFWIMTMLTLFFYITATFSCLITVPMPVAGMTFIMRLCMGPNNCCCARQGCITPIKMY